MGRTESAIKRHAKSGLRRLPFARRSRLWLTMLRRLHASSPKERLGLILSAAIDALVFACSPNRAIIPRSRFSALVEAPELDVRFHTRAGTTDLYFVTPFREADVEDAILGHLKPGDVFVDVGANIGYYTVLGAKIVGSQGKVVAVEAIPETADQLQRNIAVNGLTNVDVVQAAVHTAGGGILPMSVVGGQFGLASLVHRKGSGPLQRFQVTTTTLDDICKKFHRIKTIKLDIEGAEYGALTGAQATLAKTKYLVIECDEDIDKIIKLLRSSGFVVSKLKFSTYILAIAARKGTSNQRTS